MKKNAHYVNKVMFLFLICFACTNAFSQAWVNVTDLYVQNSGFDEDLTWNADGSTKEIVKTTTSLSTRSIAWEAADSSVYAHSAGTHTRTDGIPATSVFNGFIGRIKGWKLNTNQDYPMCEWILYGSLPYNLEEKAIPYEDSNPFFIEVPQKPTDNNIIIVKII